MNANDPLGLLEEKPVTGSSNDPLGLLGPGGPGESPETPIEEQHPELPWGERAKAMNLSANSAVAARYLRTKGFEVADRGNYKLSVRKPGGKWYVVDPSKLEWSDISDLLGDLATGVGSVVGAVTAAGTALPTGPGAIAAGIGGAAAGGAVAEAGKEALGKVLGMEPTLGEAAGAVGREAAFGAVGEGAAQLARPVFKAAGALFKTPAAVEGHYTGRIANQNAQRVWEETAARYERPAIIKGQIAALQKKAATKALEEEAARAGTLAAERAIPTPAERTVAELAEEAAIPSVSPYRAMTTEEIGMIARPVAKEEAARAIWGLEGWPKSLIFPDNITAATLRDQPEIVKVLNKWWSIRPGADDFIPEGGAWSMRNRNRNLAFLHRTLSPKEKGERILGYAADQAEILRRLGMKAAPEVREAIEAVAAKKGTAEQIQLVDSIFEEGIRKGKFTPEMMQLRSELKMAELEKKMATGERAEARQLKKRMWSGAKTAAEGPLPGLGTAWRLGVRLPTQVAEKAGNILEKLSQYPNPARLEQFITNRSPRAQLAWRQVFNNQFYKHAPAYRRLILYSAMKNPDFRNSIMELSNAL